MFRMSLILFFIPVITLVVSGCEKEESADKQQNNIEPIFTLINTDTDIGIEGRNQEDAHPVITKMNDGIIVESVKIEPWVNPDHVNTRTSWDTSDGTTSWTANDRIGIFMRSALGGSSYYDRDNVQYNVTSTATSSAVTTVSDPIYYPNPNSENVVFYAYYPYDANNNSTSISYTIPANQTGTSALASTDLMSATSASTNGDSPNTTLSFQHQLVMLSFNIKAGLTGGLLTSVTVGGTAITSTGTLDLLTNTLTPDASPVFTPVSSVGITLLPLGTTTVDIIINPCSISSNTGTGSQLYVTFVYAGLIGRTTNLTTSQVFSSGTRYTYNITFLI